jgi:quercetin dioxygenase-like cupin family protein
MKIEEYITIKHLNNEKDLSKLELGQGCIFDKEDVRSAFYHNGKPMRYLAYIEFSSKKERGNHYHKEKEENICVIKGKLKAKYWLPTAPQEIYEVDLNAGDVVNIKSGCAHSYLADNFAIAVEFSPNNYKNNDTFKV